MRASEEAVESLDRFIAEHKIPSRSVAIQEAIKQMTASDLSAAYTRAFAEWEQAPENACWDTAVADGLR